VSTRDSPPLAPCSASALPEESPHHPDLCAAVDAGTAGFTTCSRERHAVLARRAYKGGMAAGKKEAG